MAHTKTKTNHMPELSVARTIAGAVAVENAPFNAASYDPTTKGFVCTGYDTVLVTVKGTFAAGESVKIQPLIYDVDDQVWRQILDRTGAPVETPPLDGSAFAELPVFGRPTILFRISDVAGSPDDLEVLVIGGAPRAFDFYRR